MIILCLLAAVSSAAAGWLVLEAWWPRGTGSTGGAGGSRGPCSTPVRLYLAVLLGSWASSCAAFVACLLRLGTPLPMLLLDLPVITAAFLWLKRRSRQALPDSPTHPSPTQAAPRAPALLKWALVMLAGITVTLAVACFVVTDQVRPSGTWDAVAIWSLKARFVFAGGDQWTRLFSPVIAWSHPDYPLFLPMTIARYWLLLGADSPLVPALVALAVVLLELGLCAAVVSHFKGPAQGALAVLTLLASLRFLRDGLPQLADAPTGLFLMGALATAILATVGDRPAPRALALAGLLSGAAAWTKNEGLLMTAALIVATGLTLACRHGVRSLWRDLRWLLLGTLPALAFIAIIKLGFSARSHVFATQTWRGAIHEAFQASRHRLIAAAWLDMARTSIGVSLWVTLLVLSVILGVGGDRRLRSGVAIGLLTVLLVLGGDYMVFLILPPRISLREYLVNTPGRLFIQVWPALVMLWFVALGSPGELWAANEEIPRGDNSPAGSV